MMLYYTDFSYIVWSLYIEGDSHLYNLFNLLLNLVANTLLKNKIFLKPKTLTYGSDIEFPFVKKIIPYHDRGDLLLINGENRTEDQVPGLHRNAHF